MTLDPRMSLESLSLRFGHANVNTCGHSSAFQEHLRGESFYQTSCAGNISGYGVNGPSNSVDVMIVGLKQSRFAPLSQPRNMAKRQKPQCHPERDHQNNSFCEKPALGARQAYKSM
jgi:hypothetical protein